MRATSIRQKHGQQGLLKILDALQPAKKLKLVRGDNGLNGWVDDGAGRA